MKVELEESELITLLENNRAICDAFLLLDEPTRKGQILETTQALVRVMQLITQAVKSTNAIIHQITEREERKQHAD